MPEKADGNWLAIDFGERTIGLAVAHPLTGSARPLDPVRNTSAEGVDMALASLIRQWRPAGIVVGLPLDGQGNDTAMSRRIRQFAGRLAELAPDVPISLHDERLSSAAAADEFAHRRSQGRARRRDAARLDSLAAAQILDSWIVEHGKV
jgi:putative holliday junction resolvase